MTWSENDCQGHPAGPFDPMGETVFCDGSCRREDPQAWRDEPEADREPTDDEIYNGPGMEGGISYGLGEGSF